MHCRLCELINPNENHVENAERLGVSEATIRRHRKHQSRVNVEIDPSPAEMPVGNDDFFGIPAEIITSRGKTVRLPDGSYEKVSYSPARLAMMQALTYADVEKAIEDFKPVALPRNHRTSGTDEVLCMADLQVGKVDEHGGTAELINRVMETLYAAAEEYRITKPEQITLLDLGDSIENFYNTSRQAQTNDLDLTTQIRTARRLFTEAVKILSPLAPRFVFGSVPSNHCEVRVGPKAPASTPHNDFGIEINYQIEEILAGRPEFAHVEFVRPGLHDESILVRLASMDLIGAVHGHQAGAWHSLGKWWAGQSHGRRNGLEIANTLLTGHWHQHTTYPSGDNRRVIIAPSIDNGSSWYSNKSGESGIPAMLAVQFTDGLPHNERIL